MASPLGPVRCRRVFTTVLEGTRIRMEVRWGFGAGRAYEKPALIGVGDDSASTFWSVIWDRK